MGRPKKWRRVCCLPKSNSFGPIGLSKPVNGYATMTVEEYETIRLIDWEGSTQEECGNYMNIARTTVQNLYCDARKKLADVLVNGKILCISGGDYLLCDGESCHCKCGNHCRGYITESSI